MEITHNMRNVLIILYTWFHETVGMRFCDQPPSGTTKAE